MDSYLVCSQGLSSLLSFSGILVEAAGGLLVLRQRVNVNAKFIQQRRVDTYAYVPRATALAFGLSGAPRAG